MKTLFILSGIISAAYSIFADDMKPAAVANHNAVSIERTASLNP